MFYTRFVDLLSLHPTARGFVLHTLIVYQLLPAEALLPKEEYLPVFLSSHRPSRDDHERCPWASPQTWCDFATLFRLTATVHLINSSLLSSTQAMYGEYDRVSHVRNGVGVGRSLAPLWLVFGSCLHDILHLN